MFTKDGQNFVGWGWIPYFRVFRFPNGIVALEQNMQK